MIVVSQNAGLFGPFTNCEKRDDRMICDGSEIPFTVVGDCDILEIEVPDGFRAEDFDLVEGVLVIRQTSPSADEP